MITLSKKIKIMRKPRVSEYAIANFKVLGDTGNIKIGGSVSAENAMLVNEEELKSYLPNILGVSPNSPKWGELSDNYVRSISVVIGENGYDIEIGFNFSINDITRRDAVEEYVKTVNARIDTAIDEMPKVVIPEKKDDKGNITSPKTTGLSEDALALKATRLDIKDEAAVVAHIVANVEREFWWKYGKPIDPASFFLWRYCRNYRKVANHIKDADDKSLNIKFYLLDEDEVKDEKLKAFAIKNAANKAYNAVSGSIDTIKIVLYACEYGNETIACTSSDDYLMLLDRLKDEQPARFVKVASNVSKYKEHAFVEECITRGIFEKLINSNLIVDAETNETIGSSIESAVAFIKDPANAKYVNRIEGILKSKRL